MKSSSNATTVKEYLASVDPKYKEEAERVHAFVKEAVPDLKPHMQGGMIGYGSYHYKYESGREGDWFVIGMAVRAHGFSLYVSAVDEHGYIAEQAQEDFPKAKIGKSCIRFKKLEDLDQKRLADLLRRAETLTKSPK